MKKLLLFLMFLPALFWSCSKDDDSGHVAPGELVTPQFSAVNLVSQNPFTGLLIVAPAEGNSTIYYGNYNASDILSPIHALYTVVKGSILVDNAPVKLPAGQYNLVYWGVPHNTSADSTYSNIIVNEPAYVIGADMKDMYYTLRAYTAPDTTYYPSSDFVFCVQPTDIGTDKLSASLQRVTAGLRIKLTSKSGGVLNENIYAVRVLVGHVANSLNYFTGEAGDFTKTVSFPLSKSADGKEMSTNSTVMLFPGAPAAPVALIVTLMDGKELVYRQTLQNTLTAGTRLNLSAAIGDVFDEEDSSNSFEVAGWSEKSETLEFGE